MSYDASSITALKDLEPVRKRPAMFIGDTDETGFHHLLWEVLDNSIDEAMAGFCDEIVVNIRPDGSATVMDNGRGIPVDPHKDFPGKSALEVVLTVLHAGGKFDHSVYKCSGGLHGVGVSCVNALSEVLHAHVWREGHHYEVGYESGGHIAKPFKQNDSVTIDPPKDGTGTMVEFKPDPGVFGKHQEFDKKTIVERLDVIAYLNPGLVIKLFWEGNFGSKGYKTFCHKSGLKNYIVTLNKGWEVLHKPMYFSKEVDDIVVEVIIQYTMAESEKTLSYVNNIPTHDGGTHIAGFRSALTRTINSYAELKEINKNGALTGDDIREGLTCVLSLKVPDPQFVGQTKGKLGNQEIRKVVDQVMSEKVLEWLNENPKEAKIVIEKGLLARKARMAAKKARDLERKKGFGFSSLQGILTPCSSRDPEECEIFIVEGASAGGSAKKGRNRNTQAILPLRGKPLNVEKVDLDRMMKNKEIQAIIASLGCGVETVGNFDINKLRYHKVVILSDADVDGAHITTLLLTFFFRHMKSLIKAGHIYVACPPLYKIQKGRTIVYIQTEEEKESVLNSIQNHPGNLSIQRYKGLGEMDAKQLKETTMDPDGRTLLKVVIDDEDATSKAFSLLMGSEPAHRRAFIYSRAIDAEVDL